MGRTSLMFALALALVFASVPAIAQQEAAPGQQEGITGGESMMGGEGMMGQGMAGQGMTDRRMMRPCQVPGGGMMMGAMSQATETMGMMSAVTKQMADKLSTGQVSAQEARQMGQRLGQVSEMMEEMSRVMRPQERMSQMRERMSQMMREMGMGATGR
jgi:methyl-accepting chemotaxis protein